jgi:hypothetical protein
MVKRSTWILLIVLALAIGGYVFIQNHPLSTAKQTPTTTATSYLITQADGVLQSLQITDAKGNKVQLQRDLSKTWVITAPSQGVADQGLAGAAETQVGALKIMAFLDTPPASNAIGLDSPAYVISLGFSGNVTHKVEIGNLTPTSSGYYVRFDGGKIYVIAQSGIDALTKLISAPPFPATATPIATIESTITPTP